ncbi:response regulator transcription factor [Rhizobiales bacterium]|uniref:response regulator transcription factor n=1 Tax=Hongsoonwoonella zoysiae TaxID=2821844 RepID=UPI001560E7C7|nr:response regulator [Hongsoonwoonella zoysiae]NRG19123.1 response regulator transcription factor [Hongsoonwoonella zoysiae]
MSDKPATVYLIDDDESILTALSRLLAGYGYRCKRYSSAEEFLNAHDPDAPGCAVLDLELPGLDGFALHERLLEMRPGRPAIFLTGRGTIAGGISAMKSGAVDFLTKPVEADQFVIAVEAACRRDIDARREYARKKSVDDLLASLTAREREVLSHVVAGRMNKQIAADLGIVEKTVKVHRCRMMAKMRVRTVADLVRIITRHGS